MARPSPYPPELRERAVRMVTRPGQWARSEAPTARPPRGARTDEVPGLAPHGATGDCHRFATTCACRNYGWPEIVRA